MRFRREALAATVLRHPNIVACLETGTDDGQPYLVMELIEGEDLAARLGVSVDWPVGGRPGSGSTSPARSASRTCAASSIATSSPATSCSPRDGRAMVTDFGIARLAADTEGAIPGTTLGSVHYFSPEQAKGETTTGASDVYSLGPRAVRGTDRATGMAWRDDGGPGGVRIGAAAPSPRAVRPEIPAALDAVVVRALDPDPVRRFPTAIAMAAALEPIVSPRTGEPDGRHSDGHVGRGRRDRRSGRGSRRRSPPPRRYGRRLPMSPSVRRRHSGPRASPADRRAAARARCSSRRSSSGASSSHPFPAARTRAAVALATKTPTRRGPDRADDAVRRPRVPTAGPPRPRHRSRKRPPSRGRARRATCATRSSASRAAWRRGPTPRHGSSRPILFKLRDGWSTSVWAVGPHRPRSR